MKESEIKNRDYHDIDLQKWIERYEKLGYEVSMEDLENRRKINEKRRKAQSKSTVKKEPFIIK